MDRRPRPFDVIGHALRTPLTAVERAVLLTLLAQADPVDDTVTLTAGQLARFAGGWRELGAASLRSRVAPTLEAAGLISRAGVTTPTGRSTRWTVYPSAVQKVPRAHTADGTLTDAAIAWRAEVDAAVKGSRAAVCPAAREQARRASATRSVRSSGSDPAAERPILMIAPSDHQDHTVRSPGSHRPITRIAPTLLDPRARSLPCPSLPSSAFTPLPPEDQEGARSALAMALMGIDGFRGVRTEGRKLVVEVVGVCVPTGIDEVVDQFRAEHGLDVSTEPDEAESEVVRLWLMARAQLRRSLSRENFVRYIQPFDAHARGPGGVVLRADDGFFAAWVHQHYADIILAALAGVGGGHIEVFTQGGTEPALAMTRAEPAGQAQGHRRPCASSEDRRRVGAGLGWVGAADGRQGGTS